MDFQSSVGLEKSDGPVGTYDLSYPVPVYNASTAILDDVFEDDDSIMYFYTINGDFDAILDFYDDWLSRDGWNVWWETEMMDGYVFYADKGNLELSIFIRTPRDLEAPENTWDLSISIYYW